MRCKMCDNVHSNEESVKKDPRTGDFLDTCSTCMGKVYQSNAEFEFERFFNLDDIKKDL